MEILRFAWSKPHHSKGKIFPPPRGGIIITGTALAKITRDLGLPFVPHGLRSSFTDWVSENHPESENLAEMSLAHVVGSKTRRAYARSILLEQRRPLLQEYADYLTKTLGPLIAGAPRPKGDPSPQIKSKDEPATRAEPPIAAVPGTDQPAGKPGKWNDCYHCWANYKPPPSSPSAGHGERPSPKGTQATHQGLSPARRLQFVETRTLVSQFSGVRADRPDGPAGTAVRRAIIRPLHRGRTHLDELCQKPVVPAVSPRVALPSPVGFGRVLLNLWPQAPVTHLFPSGP